jgi:PAS domain S-box-containing protein
LHLSIVTASLLVLLITLLTVIGFNEFLRHLRRKAELEKLEQNRLLEEQVAERTAELRSSEERFRLLVEGTRDVAIFMLDSTGRIMSWNPGAERIKQYRAAEIIGRHFSIFYPPQDIESQKPERELEIATREGKYEEEGWRIRKDGSQFWASVVITALWDETGTLRGFSKVTKDMTERKIAEERARQLLLEETARRSAERYAREVEAERERLGVTLTSIGDAVISTDAGGDIVLLNPVAEALTGWRSEEARGLPLSRVFRIMNEFSRQPEVDPVMKVLETGVMVGLANHTMLISRGGAETPIDDSAAPIRDVDGSVIGAVLVFRDITETRRAQQARRTLALIVESSNDAIIGKDLNGIVTSWNRGAERLYGYAASEVVGQSILRIIPADRHQEFERIMETVRRGQAIEPHETIRVCKNGARIDVTVSVSAVEDEHGNIIGASAIAHDITDRKRYEQELREADRRKDEFLATLAHELRNPLAPIRNAVEILKDSNHAADLSWGRDVIDRQVHHMTRLLEDLLDVSRISHNKLDLRKESVLLAEVILSAIETSRPLIDAGGHEFKVEIPKKPIYVDADPVRLAQVFSNLLNNAARYTDRGGHISLTALRSGGEARVSVKDNGVGIAAKILPHVFDMFSQGQGQRIPDGSQGGLGIGLSLVHGLVQLHGGRIEARSEGPGKGSEFIVHLPLPERKEARGLGAPKRDDTSTFVKRRLLIVDDLRDSADTLALMLRMMGHDVETAYDGEEAVAAAARFKPDFALLDIGMPKLNGYEAARRIRREPWGKDMFLIALTGWGQEHDRNRTQEAGFNHHIVKPADPAELSKLMEYLPSDEPATNPRS